jgi:hypothetical protein
LHTTRRVALACTAFLVLAAACGDDEDDSTGTTATTEAPTGDTTGGTGGNEELCALATEMFNQETPPTAAQLEQYKTLAPDDISDAVNTAADALIPAGEDMVAFFNAFAEDDVEAAVEEIDAWETENCGIEHDPAEMPEGSSDEIEDDANRVDVVATDYAFDMPATVEAGRTSIVLTNEGAEAHFILIVKLAEGVTLEDAMAVEDPTGMIEGEWDSGLAAPGGEDEEAITLDLEPGTYGALCFVPGPDGTPHAFMGMQQEFTVS